jgi:hypothetical protein
MFLRQKILFFPIAKGGAKMFGVFRVKNHDFTPKNHIFSNFRILDPPLNIVYFSITLLSHLAYLTDVTNLLSDYSGFKITVRLTRFLFMHLVHTYQIPQFLCYFKTSLGYSVQTHLSLVIWMNKHENLSKHQ